MAPLATSPAALRGDPGARHYIMPFCLSGLLRSRGDWRTPSRFCFVSLESRALCPSLREDDIAQRRHEPAQGIGILALRTSPVTPQAKLLAFVEEGTPWVDHWETAHWP